MYNYFLHSFQNVNNSKSSQGYGRILEEKQTLEQTSFSAFIYIQVRLTLTWGLAQIWHFIAHSMLMAAAVHYGFLLVIHVSVWCLSNRLSAQWGWSSVAKVSCILCHWGVQLILANSLARPAILVAGKGRGGMFRFLLFLHFHSCSSFFPVLLFHLLYYLFYLFSPFLWETAQNDPQGLTCH